MTDITPIPKQELSADDAQKRRDLLVRLLAEYRRPREIATEMGITIPEFNKLLRETPGLADEVHATINAMHVGLRGRVVKMREEVLEDGESDGDRLAAGRDIDAAAGVTFEKSEGVKQIIIMGRDLTNHIQTAKAHDLEEIMRAAAVASKVPEAVKYVEEKIAGKKEETKGEADGSSR